MYWTNKSIDNTYKLLSYNNNNNTYESLSYDDNAFSLWI
jgi:hypothetical protein